ncbi:MAG TPA: hypothetical protein VFP43_20470 [Mesorhizobium sp.]|nr:hypothetical protein [Mesorhizobium sp.]
MGADPIPVACRRFIAQVAVTEREADHTQGVLLPGPQARRHGEENWLHWIVVTGYRNTLVFPDRTRDREDLKCNEPGNRTSRYVGLNGVVASAKSRDVNYRCYLF